MESYMAFSEWILSLCIMLAGSYCSICQHFISKKYGWIIFHYTTFLSIHQLDIWVVSVFWLLRIYCCHTFVYKFCVNKCSHFSWVYICRSTIIGSSSNSVFNILWNCQTTFHNSCTSLNFYQQVGGFRFSIFSVTLLLSLFFVIAILVSEVVAHYDFNFHFPKDQWYWVSFFVYWSFVYLFLEKCLLSSFVHF